MTCSSHISTHTRRFVVRLFCFGVLALGISACSARMAAMPAPTAVVLELPTEGAAEVSPLAPALTVAAAAATPTTQPATPTELSGPISPLTAAIPGAMAVATLPAPTPTSAVTALPTPIPPPTPRPSPLALEPTPDGLVRTAQVPILMYHYLSTPPPGADRYRVDLSVPPELFAAHLDRLLSEGYTTIGLYDLLDHLARGTRLPEKPIIITFDDGYRDNYENAFPLLTAHGMTATFFVLTDFIDEQRPEYLVWDMARAMLAGGMSIESHGRNHVSLKDKDIDYLVWQALGSLETIQYELGVRPRFVSYPAGEYDQLALDLFKSAGYWAGVTTHQGTTQQSDDLFRLQRIRVRNTTTADDLIDLVEADW